MFMFGFLKKKLKESIGKISKKVEEEADREEPERMRVCVKEEPGKEEKKPEPIKERSAKEPIEAKEEPKEEEAPEPLKEPVQAKGPEETPKKVNSVEIKEPEEPVKEPEKKKRLGLFRRKPAPESEKKDSIKKKGLLKKRLIEEKDIKNLLWDLQVSLLESDVALETAEKITEDLKKSLVGREMKKKEIEDTVRENIKNSLFEILDQESMDLMEEVNKKSPFVILFLGFNGSGKTTAIARIAHLLKKNGFKVNMAAGDTWRAAAINQLEKHGQKLDIPVVKHDYGADSAAVIFDAVKNAKSRGLDVVLADTAGRTHTNVNLMRELEKIIKVNKPDLKLLVVDSLTGNDAVEQARSFEDTVGVDGIILTKMDVNEKGGAALSVSHTIKKPILYIGTGQEYDNLEEFNPRKIIQNLLE